MRGLWAAWKIFAEKLVNFQARLVLTVLYFVLVAPFALIVKIGKDPLRLQPLGDSNWVGTSVVSRDLLAWRRQF